MNEHREPGGAKERERTVAVVGLGKIGLPLAVHFAGAGLRVLGADIDPRVVELVNRGREPFPGERDLDRLLAAAVREGGLSATTDTAEAVSQAGTVVVVVPLVVDEQARPDFSAVDAATAAVARALRPGALVCYETTLPVGTTRNRLAPALAAGSGLRPGEELFVAMSPERVFSGRIFEDLRRYPKVVGGLDEASARRAEAFYRRALRFDERPELPRPNGVWSVGSAEAAEFVKLAETTYRDVNIALANTFAVYAESIGVDYETVAQAANSQPFSALHRPGAYVGGHCIPVYPRLYLAGDPAARLVATAREVNEQMPAHLVGALAERLRGHGLSLEGLRVAVLGAAYRGGVKETFRSGVFPIAHLLAEAGALPLVHDPLFSDEELRALGLTPLRLGEPCEAAVVQADHPEYAELSAEQLPGVRVLADGRDVTDPERWPGVERFALGRAAGSPAR